MSSSESWPGEDPAVKEEVDELEQEAAEVDADDADDADDEPQLRVADAAGRSELDVPDDIDLLEGEAKSTRRGVGIVAARANIEVANRLLGAALDELDAAGVSKDSITVMAVPGVFELPLGAMALAKTRRYSCIVALGCVVGDDLVAGEAASGLQLAALETGVPVAFGVLTADEQDGLEGRGDAGADAVRTALEMADLFSQLRASAAQGQ